MPILNRPQPPPLNGGFPNPVPNARFSRLSPNANAVVVWGLRFAFSRRRQELEQPGPPPPPPPVTLDSWRQNYYRPGESRVQRLLPIMLGRMFVSRETPLTDPEIASKAYVDAQLTTADASSPIQPFEPGRYYHGNFASSTTTLSWTRPQAAVSMFFLSFETTFDRWGFHCTNTPTGVTARAGIYDISTDTMLPTALAHDLGSTTIVNGTNTVTLGTAITLQGPYGLVLQVDGGVTNPTLAVDFLSQHGRPSDLYGAASAADVASLATDKYALRSTSVSAGSLPAASFWAATDASRHGSGLMLRRQP